MKPTNPFADFGGTSSNRPAVKNPFESVPDLTRRTSTNAVISTSASRTATTEASTTPYTRSAGTGSTTAARNPFADFTLDAGRNRPEVAARAPSQVASQPPYANGNSISSSFTSSGGGRQASSDFNFSTTGAPTRRQPPTSAPSPQHSSPPMNTKKSFVPGPPIAEQDQDPFWMQSSRPSKNQALQAASPEPAWMQTIPQTSSSSSSSAAASPSHDPLSLWAPSASAAPQVGRRSSGSNGYVQDPSWLQTPPASQSLQSATIQQDPFRPSAYQAAAAPMQAANRQTSTSSTSSTTSSLSTAARTAPVQSTYTSTPAPAPAPAAAAPKPQEDSTRSSVVRASKFRHVFCDPPKVDATFTNFRLSAVTGEQNYIKANPLFFAVGIQGGGGPFAVVPLSTPGRFEPESPIISGHSAPVLDFDFNPFNDFILASASEDQSVKIWNIPEGGLTSTITEPLVDLRGHARKVLYLRFRPTASNVLASASGDQTVKLWDIERGCEIQSLNNMHDQLIQDVVWDYRGDVFATSSKDKHVRMVDGRSAQVVNTIWNAHEGTKTTKLTFLGPLEKLVTVGFTRQSQRQFKIWDPRNTSEEIKKVDIDHAAGTIMPFFDPDTNLLYLAGKGDGNVRYYEVVNENPYCHPLSEVRTSVSAKGMAWVPKRGLNVMACETARLLKLTTNSVEPLSFFVPRRSEAFQEDLYPDTASGEPAHTADQWLDGSSRPPRLMSLNPALNIPTVARSGVSNFGFTASASSNTAQNKGAAGAVSTAKSAAQLQTELDSAHARIHTLEDRIKFLEGKLKSYGIRVLNTHNMIHSVVATLSLF